jgi:hypothetical protein
MVVNQKNILTHLKAQDVKLPAHPAPKYGFRTAEKT